MRIRELQIHRFRQHLDAHYVFDAGLNVIVGPNESGKSSLQMAILFALFGNPRHTTLGPGNRAIKVGDYAAWGSDTSFAIELDFDATGGSYHLAKDWQAGTARLEVPNGTLLTDADTVQQMLEDLLGCASPNLYMNTACVRQDDLASVTSGQEAIGDALIQRLSGSDEASLAEVLALLDKSVKDQKNKGNKNPGAITRIQREWDETSKEMARIQLSADRVHTAREELAELQSLKSEVTAALKEQEGVKEALTKAARWEEQKEQAQQEEDALDKTLEQIAAASKRESEAATEVETLQAFGAEGLSQEVNSAHTRIKVADERVQTLIAELEEKQNQTDSDLEKLDERQEELKAARTAIVEKKPTSFIALIIGAAFLIAGGLLCSSNHSWGIILALVGAIGLGGWTLFRRLLAASHQKACLARQDAELADIEKQRVQLDKELGEAKQELDEARETESQARQGLEKLLAPTGAVSIAEFNEKYAQYQQANQKRLIAQTELETLLQGKLSEDIENSRRDASRRRRDALEALEDEEIAAVVGMPALERQRLIEQLAGLQERADNLNDELIRCRTIIEHAGDADTRLLDLQARQENLKEQLARAEEWLSVCQIAQEIMQQAGSEAVETVRTRLEPVIANSLQMLTEHYTRARVNKDLSIEVYDAMADRWLAPEAGILSEGTVDQIYLISRLAMVQALFDDDSPPVMLDDPFVTFDATRRAQAMTLCRELATEYQILLFTCHTDLARNDDHVIELARL